MKAQRLPFADWRPSPNFGGYSRGHNPKASVTHSADSNLMDGPPARFFTRTPTPPQKPGSVHLWIKGDGHITQMVEFGQSAWGNGATDRVGGPPDNTLIQGWYAQGINPNTETFSIELTGFGKSKGARFTAVTEAQWASWARIHEWLVAEQWITTFDARNLLLHSMISATACPDGRVTVEDLVAHLSKGADMTALEDLIIALYAGAELAGKPREERLKYAMYRMTEAAEGRERSLRQQIENAQAHVHALQLNGTTSVPTEV